MMGYSLKNWIIAVHIQTMTKKKKKKDLIHRSIHKKKSSTQINESNSHPIHLLEWTGHSSNFPNKWINKSKNPPIHLNELIKQQSNPFEWIIWIIFQLSKLIYIYESNKIQSIWINELNNHPTFQMNKSMNHTTIQWLN